MIEEGRKKRRRNLRSAKLFSSRVDNRPRLRWHKGCLYVPIVLTTSPTAGSVAAVMAQKEPKGVDGHDFFVVGKER